MMDNKKKYNEFIAAVDSFGMTAEQASQAIHSLINPPQRAGHAMAAAGLCGGLMSVSTAEVIPSQYLSIMKQHRTKKPQSKPKRAADYKYKKN